MSLDIACTEIIAAAAFFSAEEDSPQSLADRIVRLVLDGLQCGEVRLRVKCYRAELLESSLRREACGPNGSNADESRFALPVHVGEIEGTLILKFAPGQSPHADEHILTNLATCLVSVVGRAQVLQQTVRRSEMLARLSDVTNTITGHLDVDRAINDIMRCAAEGLRADGADIWLREGGDHWRLAYGRHLGDGVLGWRLPIHLFGPSAERILLGEAFVAENLGQWVSDHPRMLDTLPDGPGVATVQPTFENVRMVGAPLWSNGGVSGVLIAFREGGSLFTTLDADFLVMFANAASTVLHNADMYSEVARLKAELESRVEARTHDLAKTTTMLQRALKAITRVQEEERARIGDDLHDRSCQLVAGALYEVQSAQKRLEKGDIAGAEERVGQVKKLLRKIDAENRQVIENLSPLSISKKGFVDALERYIRSCEERYDGSWTLCVLGSPVRMSKGEELAAFRVAREALVNAAKHASAQNVVTTLAYESNQLTVTIEDDGVGFDSAVSESLDTDHIGLVGMRERVESNGGHIEIRPREPRGTSVKFVLPIR